MTWAAISKHGRKWQKVAESSSECFKGRSVTGDASA